MSRPGRAVQVEPMEAGLAESDSGVQESTGSRPNLTHDRSVRIRNPQPKMKPVLKPPGFMRLGLRYD